MSRVVHLALLALLLVATSRAAAPDDRRAAATLPERPVLGFAVNAHHIGRISLYTQAVDRIADLGANSLILVTPMFQDKVTSTEIYLLPDRCPTDEQLIRILRRARKRGLHTTLLPIVLIEYPVEKDWRGVIRPTDWEAWWRSYDQFVDHFLDIAIAADVDVLSVGSELNSTEEQYDRWKQIVDRVRKRYDGVLTYSANWDRYDKVSFWPLVDVMCVSAYFELVPDDPDADHAALVAAWRVEQQRLLACARRWQRPLVLSEVGYPSLPWASAHPWDYVRKNGVEADHEAQARCFAAFFEVWGRVVADPSPANPAAGFFLYRWDPYNRGGPDDTGYGVRGKPSYEVIEDAFAEIDRDARAARDAEGATP